MTEVLAILDRCEYGVLSLTDREGLPYGVPLSLVRKGKVVYFHGRRSGRKMELIGRGCPGSLACVAGTRIVPIRFTTQYRSVIAEGFLEVVEDEEERIEALRLLSMKYAPEAMAFFERELEKRLERTAVFRMTVERMTVKGSLEP